MGQQYQQQNQQQQEQEWLQQVRQELQSGQTIKPQMGQMGQMGQMQTTMGQQGQNASLATMDPTTYLNSPYVSQQFRQQNQPNYQQQPIRIQGQLRQNIMMKVGELVKEIPYETLVDKSFAEKAIEDIPLPEIKE